MGGAPCGSSPRAVIQRARRVRQGHSSDQHRCHQERRPAYTRQPGDRHGSDGSSSAGSSASSSSICPGTLTAPGPSLGGCSSSTRVAWLHVPPISTLLLARLRARRISWWRGAWSSPRPVSSRARVKETRRKVKHAPARPTRDAVISTLLPDEDGPAQLPRLLGRRSRGSCGMRRWAGLAPAHTRDWASPGQPRGQVHERRLGSTLGRCGAATSPGLERVTIAPVDPRRTSARHLPCTPRHSSGHASRMPAGLGPAESAARVPRSARIKPARRRSSGATGGRAG